MRVKPAFYLLSAVVVQLVVLVTVFEFLRRPWEGVELEIEKILEFQENKILEDCMSSIDMGGSFLRGEDKTIEQSSMVKAHK